MRIKVYMAMLVKFHNYEASGNLSATTSAATHWETEKAARNWLDMACKGLDEDVQNPAQALIFYKPILHAIIIETDDFQEYKPSYEIELSMKVEKRIQIIVDGEFAASEDEARDFAEQCAYDGTYEQEFNDEDEYDVEYEVLDVDEIED